MQNLHIMTLKAGILLFLSVANFTYAMVVMPQFFSDNMVIQRDAEIPVWGKADPHELVTVIFKNQRRIVNADENGQWSVIFRPEKFGGPYTLKISGKNEILIQNILIGDVWLCSGQSNMEWSLSQADSFENELMQPENPLIRHIKIPRSINTIPQQNVEKASWQIAHPSTIGGFSAVAYHFAKKMVTETKIPVGLINASWGGTNIETWIPRDAFEKSPDFQKMISKMPKISLDSLSKLVVKSKIDDLQKRHHLKLNTFNETIFILNEFNDKDLPEIIQPMPWEAQGFEGLDGVVWLRKTITLSAQDLQKDAQLNLSQIDDADVTYFNGVQVGNSDSYDAERQYTIPKNLLKLGKNVIAIKISDYGGGGGIWGSEDNLKLITPKSAINLKGKWKIAVQSVQEQINQNDFPSLTYSAMIAPLVPLNIKGFLWYQGESNADRAVEYNKSFPLLINSFREKFGEDLPFYFVQLASFETPGKDSNEGSPWAELREAQLRTLKTKNTGMVVTIDIGDPKDIHPGDKKSVGERLANLALKNGLISPIFHDYKKHDHVIEVSFTPNHQLTVKNNASQIKGFEILDQNGKFHPANAQIKENSVIVWSDSVKNPLGARFGWKGDASENNLFTESGLPIAPFRTDNLPLKTDKEHYRIILNDSVINN